MIGRAGRTLLELCGRGINKRLLQAVDEFIRRRYPNANRQRFTSLKSYDSHPALTKLAQLDMLSAYVREHYVRVTFLQPTFLSRSKPAHNVIALEFIPVEPLRSNIDYFQQECDLHFAVDKCSDGSFPRSVSFGVFSPRVKHVHWSVTVYTSDPDLYEAHLLHQFKRACEVIKGDFRFDTFQDKRLTNHGKRVLRERLQLKLNDEMSKMSVKLYEAKFVQQSHL